jgi:short-subunit dehydrogenase
MGLLSHYAYYTLALVGALTCLKAAHEAYMYIDSKLKKTDLAVYGQGSWAVIAGGFEGKGLAFAESLAALGYNLYVLASSSEEVVCAALKSAYGVDVHIRPWDFSQSCLQLQALTEVLEADLSSRDVSILVHNVRSIQSSDFPSAASLHELLATNCFPLAYLCRLLLPKLRSRRNRSAIITLRSQASEHGLDSATQRFQEVFSSLLAESLRASNVAVIDA